MALLEDLQAEAAELAETIKLIKDELREHVETAGDYDDGEWKVTRVQGFSRKWNGDKLAKIVGKGMFLKLVDYTPNADKINEMVAAGKLNRNAIKAAYEETPNAAYVKITKVTEKNASDEAAKVRKALG